MIRQQIVFICTLCLALATVACAQKKDAQSVTSLTDFPEIIYNEVNYNSLTSTEKAIIINKGTEYAFTGEYYNLKADGTYICKQCNLPLFRSEDKFDSRTGWPSFDDMIDDNVKEVPDADGRRIEIVCANCEGHLGHVFRNEGFTSKMTRHCVNSTSLTFVEKDLEEKKALN